MVGARPDDENGSDSGSAYVFGWNGSQWVETKLVASDAASFDNFGTAVAVSRDRVVVGALGDDSFRGSVYVFDWDGSQWVET